MKKESNQYKVAYIGAIDNNQRDGSTASRKYVREAVNELLTGKTVTTPTARAVGCGIKWRNA